MSTNRISVSSLKRKYPHPVRAMGSKYDDYCVGGALCVEVGLTACLFPSEYQLKEAALKANRRLDWNTMSDSERDEFYSTVTCVLKANDVGSFELAWKALGKLLHWK